MGLHKQSADASQLVLPALDTALLFSVFYLVDYSPASRVLRHAGLASYPSLLFVGFVLTWGLLAQQYANVYQPGRLATHREKLSYVLCTMLLHAGLVALGMLLLGNQLAPLTLLVPYLATIYLGMLVAIPAGRLALTCALRTYRRYLAPRRRHVIVGLGHSGLALHHILSGRAARGSEFMGFFVEDYEEVPAHLRHLVRGTVATLKTFCRGNRVDELYFALPLDRQVLRDDLAEYAAAHRLAFRIVPDFAGISGRHVSGRLPERTMRRVLLGLGRNQAAKRGLDIVFSSLVIALVLSWVLPLLALLIKLDSRGPVLAAQLRPGCRNQLFLCYQLRTTWHDPARPELPVPRLTRVGRYLRRYSLDELPQFFNVLLGDMSVVGLRSGGASQPEVSHWKSHAYTPRPILMPSIAG